MPSSKSAVRILSSSTKNVGRVIITSFIADFLFSKQMYKNFDKPTIYC